MRKLPHYYQSAVIAVWNVVSETSLQMSARLSVRANQSFPQSVMPSSEIKKHNVNLHYWQTLDHAKMGNVAPLIVTSS